jgi:hypothetical protein
MDVDGSVFMKGAHHGKQGTKGQQGKEEKEEGQAQSAAQEVMRLAVVEEGASPGVEFRGMRG